MNPDAVRLWLAPRWALAVLLAVLSMLGPFSIDTYIPAFADIAASLEASPVEMQQTLSAYLFGFAFMNLFHGALSDSVGRRPVVLWGIGLFTLASIGCALAQSIEQLIVFRALQGLCSGAGIVVSRAVVRDMFAPDQAQKVMSQITIVFGLAPAVAPLIGGWLTVYLGWPSIFWFLATIGTLLWLANFKLLPESLHVDHRQPFSALNLLRGYRQLISDPRFMLLTLASGVPFNGMFLYVLSAPVFLGEHLRLAPTQFFWFFCCTIGGIMGGAWASGRLAGRINPARQVRHGFTMMVVVSAANIGANFAMPAHVSWALLPTMFYGFGWSLMTPVVTLMLLDVYPQRRGMASSLQACIGAGANGVVAGVIAPLVMHSTRTLALASAVLMMIGLIAWLIVRTRWPQADHAARPS